MRTIAATVLVVVGCLSFRGMATAQEAGAVAGVVKDKSGAVLPGVTVRVASVGLVERVQTTVTDGNGRYRVVNLPAGVYTVTFLLAGYSPVVRSGVAVSAGLTAAVDADLGVGLPGFASRPHSLSLDSIASAPLMRPYVRCGLTIVPADPSVDPKIRVPIDHAPSGSSVGSRTEHSMRTVAPQICAER
jgi:hypothetical protein